ncbi:MAG: hypothetical protein HY586_05085 [Candidatus Omnitrophica bacterium]|nr:hypothetical protein [Candidatus Omnitrophota bacterium]
MSNTSKWICAAIFFAGMGFWFFLVQNLPFTFGDDLNVIFFARNHSWRNLILSFLNPLTPALYVHGAASLESTRALEPLLFRTLFALFGYDPNPFWLVKCVSVAGVASSIFFLVWRATRKTFVSLLAAIFFLLASPMYRGIAWIADLEILAQLGNILAAAFFLELYISGPAGKTGESRARTFLSFLLMTASYWIGLKSKETGRVFPFIALAFIALDQNFHIFKWLKERKTNWFLVLIPALLLLTIIPLSAPDESLLDQKTREATGGFHISNIPLALWANPTSEKFPADLLHTFGWPLVLLIIFLAAGIKLHFFLRRNPPIERNAVSYILYFFIWTGLALGGTCMGFRLADNERYLTVLIVPAVLLAFSCLGLAVNILDPRIWLRRIISAFIVVCTAIPIVENLGHIIFMRNVYSAADIADWKATEKIFEDRFGYPASPEGLDAYYRGTAPYSKEEFHASRIKEWDTNTDSSAGAVKRAAQKWNGAYVLSFKENVYAGDETISLLLASDTHNQSFYAKILPRIKKKTLRKFYLYKANS